LKNVNSYKKLFVFFLVLVLLWLFFRAYILINRKLESMQTESEVKSLLIDLDFVKHASTSDLLLSGREFIHNNSRNVIDDEFWSYYQDHPRLIRMMKEASIQRSSDKDRVQYPHMECSTRAGVFQSILRSINIPSRIITVYAPMDSYPSHVFIEIYNSDYDAWEVYDPSYDVSYRATDYDGYPAAYLSIEEIVRLGPEGVNPCRRERCGWGSQTDTLETDSNDLKKYLSLAVRFDDDGSTTLINRSGFDTEALFVVGAEKKTFCEYRPHYCSSRSLYFE